MAGLNHEQGVIYAAAIPWRATGRGVPFLTEEQVQLGVGFLGVSLAAGLAVLSGAYAFGHVSSGHFNPAVTIGLAVAKRFEWRGVGPYIGVQIVAATVAGALLLAIGLGLTVIHLVGIPVTNLSVNPARSLGVAWFGGAPALAQVWLFLVALVIGAAIAGVSYSAITRSSEKAHEGIAQNP
jgi:glycerol uptake facilitator-like aquaporin